MTRLGLTPRILVAAAAQLLGVMFIAPLWSIRLIAPQYPEGLGLLIRLSTITGVKEHDLNSINSLNHYIGMKPIVPDAIPELRYMPWIVGGLMVAGIIVAVAGHRRALIAWLVAFALVGAAGLYDFWRWGYDYGHNLDRDAAIIEVPGMTYQPPLIGSKQLLNFHATSMPHAGAVAAGFSFLLAATALGMTRGTRRARVPAASAVLAATVSCAAPAHAIDFGHAACAECGMIVTDRRFGALMVTATGKTMVFDSIECMRARVARGTAPAETWVVDAMRPGTLVRGTNAELKQDGLLRPPMGTVYAVAH